jgi:hypothetical protein
MDALIFAPDLDPFALIGKAHYRTCQHVLKVWGQAMQ